MAFNDSTSNVGEVERIASVVGGGALAAYGVRRGSVLGTLLTLLGGAAVPKLFEHIAEYCDGWMPIGGAGIRAALGDLRGRWEERGRDWSAAKIVPFGVLPDEGKLDYYASIGCTEVVLRVPTAPRDEVMPALDEFLNASAQQQVDLFESREVQSAEGGVKFANSQFGVTVNGFYTKLKTVTARWPTGISAGAEFNFRAR